MRRLCVMVTLPLMTALLACAAGGAGPALGSGDTATQQGVLQPKDVQPMPIDQKGPPGQRVRSPVLDQALAANSSAALIMFLWHHPDDAFAEDARSYLRNRPDPDPPAAIRAAAGAEAPAVAAFDAARRAGSAAAWQAFLAQYGATPLARQVPFFR